MPKTVVAIIDVAFSTAIACAQHLQADFPDNQEIQSAVGKVLPALTEVQAVVKGLSAL